MYDLMEQICRPTTDSTDQSVDNSSSAVNQRRELCLGTVNFPGDFDKLPDVVKELIAHADSVELQFQAALPSTTHKSGVVKAAFASAEDAVRCHTLLKSMIDTCERKWDLRWLSNAPDVEMDNDSSVQWGYSILVRGLPNQVDNQNIADVFGSANVANLVIGDQASDGHRTAVVTFKSVEMAKQAQEQFQNYQLTIGQVESFLSIEPYPSQLDMTDVAEEMETGQNGVEATAEQLCVYLKQMMNRDRINWAELNTEEELWALLNNFTKEIGWQPEELLKETMMLALRIATEEMGQYDWMTDHLSTLIKKWSKVVDNCEKSKTRKRLQLMETEDAGRQSPGAHYVPPPEKSRRRRKNRGQGLMSVGSVLSAMKCQAEAAAAAAAAATTPQATVAIAEKADCQMVAKKKVRRVRDESSESGEASTSSESDKDEELTSSIGQRTPRQDGPKRTVKDCATIGQSRVAHQRSDYLEPELVQQVVSSVLRLMPMINEWRSTGTKAPPDYALRQDMLPMNFTLPPPPPIPQSLPRTAFGFIPNRSSAGVASTNFPLILGGAPPMRPPPLQINHAPFGPGALAQFYRMPPPCNRPY